MNPAFPRPRTLLLEFTALFALLWAIARACVQAVTIDEADTYLGYVQPSWPSHWYPASGNHVLNSMLMRLFTSVFGLSHLTLRAPALIGGAIIIATSYCFCKLISRGSKLQWPLFVCLVFNPFIFDYMVAARGYSLALAFLLCAIAIPAYVIWENMNGRPKSLIVACALGSACAGLSFSANFSFAFVNCAALAATFVWSCRRETRIMNRVRLFVACSLPALLVAFFLCGSTVLQFSKKDLVYGATSLRETLNGVVAATLYEPNQFLVHPILNHALELLTPILLPLLCLLCIGQLILIFLNRSGARDIHTAWLISLGWVLGAIVVLSVSMHWLSFHLFHVLLPKDRTAIYFVTLCTLVAGILAAIPVPGKSGKLTRAALIAQLFVLAGFFLLCMRLEYFKEWKYNADVKNVYSVVAYYNHAYGVKEIDSKWMYVSCLNLYEMLSGHETISKFVVTQPYRDRLVYVLYEPDDRGFIEEHKLKVVYRGNFSDVVVAVKPEVESQHASPQ